MRKHRLFMAAAIAAISAALALSGCTINPYTGEREVGNAAIGAGVGAAVGAGVGALAAEDEGEGALIGAAAGAALGGGVGYYMDVQEAKLRRKMRGTGVSVTRQGDRIILNMPNTLTFAIDSSSLKPAAANTLTGVAMVLKEYTQTGVIVVGHTDTTGSREYNMALSQRRADSVASALILQGVAASRIRTRGAGPDNPVASNRTEAGRAQNRRVEITLIPLRRDGF